MKTPLSQRAQEDEQLLKKIRTSYQASDRVYGSPRVHRDLREDGERCGEHRVARLMLINGFRAIRGYKKPRYKAGKPAVVAPNWLEQNFSAAAADRVWATDITYIRTFEGWLYLAVVVDLYSRIVVGWSMKSTLTRDLVLDALLMAVWRRRTKHPVILFTPIRVPSTEATTRCGFARTTV
jgi:putative transposase